jgi:single-strand DNA-binding protein
MTTTLTPTATVGFVGNLTDDPELRFSNAGKPWCSFKLAVRPYLAGADVQPEPVFYSVVCFGSLAENACETLHKGSRVVVSGRLEEDTWTGRDGQERVTLKIVADGVGKDLRFAEPAKRTMTPVADPAPKGHAWLDEHLGPTPATEMEPF